MFIRVFTLCVVLLDLTLTSTTARSIRIPERFAESHEDSLQDKMHMVGQLLLNCLSQFDTSNLSETPVVISQHYPYMDYNEAAMTDELSSMIRQMERQLFNCRELLKEY
ncbi:hypothetical protein ElyMa_000988100 [Elysia marginata]|uniref:Uncharacterized protein n=1 Tax=Elysia marginata TaxID=1093978 RepID=A0AAV4HKN6_9GAST|nr:hypothetical protein ElyMa_000988100 [Elysia marginata]